MRAWHLFSVVSVLALAACATDAPPPAKAVAAPQAAAAPAADAAAAVPAAPAETFDPSSYQVDSGDKIRLIVYGEQELSGEFQINDKGELAMPLVGTVNAKNATARDLEKRIAAKLSEGYLRDPKVSVEILNYRPFYIIGEVRNPGNYSYVSGMTVINAVAMAGGYTYRGKTSAANIKRSKTPDLEETVPVSTQVFPGDVVIIKERYF